MNALEDDGNFADVGGAGSLAYGLAFGAAAANFLLPQMLFHGTLRDCLAKGEIHACPDARHHLHRFRARWM